MTRFSAYKARKICWRVFEVEMETCEMENCLRLRVHANECFCEFLRSSLKLRKIEGKDCKEIVF